MFRRLIAAGTLFLALALSSHSATQKWVVGTLTGYSTAVCSTELNTLPNGDALLCSTSVNNATNGDLYGMLSITFGSVTTFAGAPYVQAYIYTLNQDGSTYGDGTFTSAGAGPPAAQYATNCVVPAPASGTQAFKGECGPFPLPPLAFKIVLYSNLNSTGNAASSGNAVYLNTYNFSIQ